MNAEESHYLKKLKTLKNTIDSKVTEKRKNILGVSSWDRSTKTFQIHHVLKTCKDKVNHIEIDALDNIEALKKHTETFFVYSKCSPCDDCCEVLCQWSRSNRLNLIVWGFERRRLISDQMSLPSNLLLIDMTNREMINRRERRQTLNLNETLTKETFDELLSRMDRSFHRSAEKKKVLKPIINSPKPPSIIKMNNFIKTDKSVTGVDIEKEKLIINKLLRIRKSQEDMISLSTASNSLESTPVGSGRRRQLHPIINL